MSQSQLPPTQQPPGQGAEDQFATSFCRAMYDYDAQDASALSFRRGDIIEVLTKQPSGWWDGLLGDERGWFPSNYVAMISDEEAEASFGDAANTEDQTSDEIAPGFAEPPRTSQPEHEDWLDRDLGYRSDSQEPTSRVQPATTSNQPSDFWLPEVTPDGQIYYVNTQTGQRARDLPQENEAEVSDRELSSFASQANSRSATSMGLPFGPSDLADPSSDTEHLETNGSAEWVKQRADDGISYYYLNTLTGQIKWPEDDGPSTSSSQPSTLFPPAVEQSRLSVYSDDSDIQPFDHLPAKRQRAQNGKARANPNPRAEPNSQAVLELTSAERIAKILQQSLEPGPPDAVADLSVAAKGAIQAVIQNIQTTGLNRQSENDIRLDELVYNVVLAVRNLLYIGAAFNSQLTNGGPPTRNHSSQNPLKPTQRKVTATLSRLVLSARAMQYDSGSQLADTLGRIETDSEELERAVAAFVLEVQRYKHDEPESDKKPKRLQGVFSTSNIGLGLVGGGAAGSWKGFGWVSFEDESLTPQRPLNADSVSEVASSAHHMHEYFIALNQALRITSEHSVPQVQIRVQDLLSQLSSFLALVADIHVARHVDIDGIRQAGDAAADDRYVASVDTARRLVRALEGIVQSVYDDSSAILLATQTLQEGDRVLVLGEREAAYDLIDRLAMSLESNLGSVRQTFEDLLSIGHEQADLAQGDYNGSIEWRMSRMSLINDHFGSALAAPNRQHDAYNSENEDVVDMELAFNRPGLRKQKSAADASYESYRTLAGDNAPSVPDTESYDSTIVTPHPDHDDFDNDDTLFEDERPRKNSRAAGGSKLLHVLGEEYADKVAADRQPWYLRPNYAPEDIIIENDGSVRGGTVPALVEKLTAHEGADPSFSKAFLMTYKSFTTLDELFDLLVARFRIQPPEQLSVSERDEWARFKQQTIQLRVLNTFKSMITEDDGLEKEDMYILDKMKDFLTSEEASKFPASKSLMNVIDRAQRSGDNIKTFISTTLGPPPPPIVPRTNKKLKLLDVDPLELARQLTIMESQLFQRIKPMECLQRAREQKTDTIDNIALVIQTSNRIADWVADLVLSKEDSRRRAQVVKHLIGVADRCRAFNNFSTMIAITSGLNTPPIRRLKRTWDQVPARFMSQFHVCEMTIDSNKNFTNYRQLMASVNPPCVPFIGVFLSTLLFIQQGNKDTLPGGLVNFRKRQKASEVINDIKRWQTQPFNFQALPAVLAFINDSLAQYSDTRASSEHFWARSLEREPREREDEKMARLLQESGFL